MSKVDSYTAISRQAETYSDFTDNLDLNPVTGLLARYTNEDSVKAAIRHLVLTNIYERPYTKAGSKVQSLLFDPMDDITSNLIQISIEDTIRNYEPRVSVNLIQVVPIPDKNQYNVTIIFSVINIPNSTTVLPILLKVVR